MIRNDHQLRRWLMREIWGESIPRRKRRYQPGRNARYKAFIRSLPCAACGHPARSEAAHTGPHAFGKKASDYRAIPLCRMCHLEYHRGCRAFERAHGLNLEALVCRLNSIRNRSLREGI